MKMTESVENKKQGADAVPVSVSNRWADSVEEEEREGIREPEKVDGEVEKVAEGIQQLETDEKKEQEGRSSVTGLLDELVQHEVEVHLADIQANKKSPLHSVHSFEELGLKEDLLKGVYAMEFNKPSKIQEKALPLLLGSPPRNLIAQSQSGTGKTAAFVLTMLSRVDTTLDAPQALCLSPTRELARQIGRVVEKMGQFTKARVTYVLRDMDMKGETIADHIVIGTPGTIKDLVRRGRLRLHSMKVFVLDEADVMLDMQGLGDQSIRIKMLLPPTCQIVLFSATFPPKVREFANRVVPNANVITLRREELSLDAIKQFYMDCKSYEHKYQVLSQIYGLLTIGQSIVFCQTRATADELYRRMTAEGHTISLLHGGLSPEQRDAVIEEFRKGTTKVLIATNVLARGIDILQVSLVINFDLPLDVNSRPDCETYLHRIGRTGRFGRNGVSINFVHDRKSLEDMLYIQRFFGREIVQIPTEDLELIETKLRAINEQ